MYALVLFAKYPEPGKVKKQIGTAIGMENSARLFKAFVTDLVTKNSDKDYDLYLSFIGKENKQAYKSMFPNAIMYVQRGKNLGENILCSFEDLLDDYDKVIILSCDVPQIPSNTIVRAFNALDSYDVVVGPATDGGYYLIGLKTPAKIFDKLPWGTETLLKEQLQKIKSKKLSYVLLEDELDVDTPEELTELKKILTKDMAPNTFKFLEQLDV